MVTFIRSDLEFILQQIQFSETAGDPANLANLIGSHVLPYGIRTVDGTYNNLLPGNSDFGAADTLFPRLVPSNPLNEADGETFNGGPGIGLVTNTDYAAAGNVVDSDPRTISNLIVDQTSNNPAAAQRFVDLGLGSFGPGGELLDANGVIIPPGTLLELPNVAPDEGLSAQFNSWFTLFGQFFDHGLDLVTKGGNGTVFIPLQPDDPLITHGPDGVAGSGDEVTNPALQFMALTRATPTGGEHTNTTTSWVDQNQTYTSHASHQVFLREYETVGGKTVATGKLLDYSVDGGIANWGQVKAQALTMLGIELSDYDVGNVPLLLTDAYGKFIPHPTTGYAQVIIGTNPDGSPITVSGTPADPINLFDVHGDGTNVQAMRTGHAFLDDIAHAAGPFNQSGTFKSADTDSDVGLSNGGNPTTGFYDDELLDAHKVTGDGRGNENIGLTSVHHVFHAEHNRLVEHIKDTVLATGDAAFIAQWQNVDGSWNGERLFQAAKFGTEMQYQHLVFEEFARKVQPEVNVFGPYNAEIDPSIVAEFAHVVYRFGHSMLNEDVARMNPDGTTNDVGLIAAFLNPVMFDAAGTADEAAGAVIRGMTRQAGNEIDEFVTGALRNNLLGLPLDLAVLNLARARDTGSPTLNEARAQFFAGTGDSQLKPYESWVEFAANAKNELSVINFIAAYGQHEAVTSAITLEDKRKAAVALVLGDNDGTPDTVLINGVEVDISDRFDFINSAGAWNAANSGLDDIDFWIGGLAEKQMPFGGLLGSTFNFVFETQLEALQDSDRFYYLNRLAGTHFLTELEGNSFAALVMKNTNLGEDGMHLPGDIFSVPNWILEVDQTKQVTGINPGPDGVGRDDPTGGSIFNPMVQRNNPATVGPDTNYLKYTGGDHVVLGGTNNADILIASIGDDTIWGDGGNDRIEGGEGNDILNGGDGDDIITDSFGIDNIKGGAGNDVINIGAGLGDLILAGDGNDFTVGGRDAKETFGGEGNDYIIAGDDADVVFGDGGDDWIQGGNGNDLLQGDFGNPFQDSAHVGNDVIMGGAGNDDYDSESGDDIMLADDGIERNEGMLGFDWVSYEDDPRAANADLFFRGLLPPDQDAIRDRFDMVEGLSGGNLNDTLRGDNADAAQLTNVDAESGQNNAINSAAQIALIDGLQDVLGAGVTSFAGGNIILGGGGSDLIEGRGGNDIIDGDRRLNVRLEIHENIDGTGAVIGSAEAMDRAITSTNVALNGKTLVELMFAGTLNPGQLSIKREIINDGPAGIDTAFYSDVRDNYAITPNADGSFTVSHIVGGVAGADGTDRIMNIERLSFADITISPTGAPIVSTPPTALAFNGTTTVQENVTGFVFGTLTVTDPDVGDFHRFTVSDPRFEVIGNILQLTAADSLNFEAEPTLTITITATDPGNNSISIPLTITVLDQLVEPNLPPVPADPGPIALTVLEDTPIDGDLGEVILPGGVDPNGQIVTFELDEVFGLINGVPTSLAGIIAVNHDTGALDFTPPQDFNGDITFRYQLSDGIELSAPITVTLTVLPENDAPTGTPTAVLADGIEDAAYVVTATQLLQGISDVDLDVLTVTNVVASNGSVVEGPVGTFTITPDANFFGIMTLTYDVDDGNGGVLAGVTNTYEVISDNLAPINLLPATASVAENATAGTVVANLSAVDPDGDPITFSLVDGAQGRFSIVGNQVVVNSQALLDFERNTTHAITFRATDDQGRGTSRTITVNVTNVAEGLTLTGGAGANTLNGGAGVDRIAGLGGNDTLNGLGGDDVLDGGAGNDTMNGGTGNDTFIVDSQNDVTTEAAGAANGIDTTITNINSYALRANVENLILTNAGGARGIGTGNDNVIRGNAGDDRLEGRDGNDILIGEGGDDLLQGGAGTDQLFGGAGADDLDGGVQNDTLDGGAGNDTYVGGAGADTMVFRGAHGNDIVEDFGDVAGDQDVLLLDSSVFATFEDVQAAMATVGNDVVITTGAASSITLQNIDIAILDRTDFRFG